MVGRLDLDAKRIFMLPIQPRHVPSFRSTNGIFTEDRIGINGL
jgi:hypothetical protein